MRQAGWRLRLKQVFDRSAALVGLVATAPILAVSSFAVRVTMGGPVLFRQQRPGLHGRTFELVKLRTMLNSHGPDGQPLPDDVRLTRLGKFLRSTSIDELPQLWNVLQGDISLVGPRPLLIEYLPRYTQEQGRRHDVLPGITGWSQINGRNSISWPEKLALDIWYVDHWDLLLDVRILLLTVVRVLRRDGVTSAGHATMPPLPDQH